MLYEIEYSCGRDFFMCERYDNENTKVQMHMHRHYELIYVSKGSLVVNYSNTNETLHSGEYALIFSNVLHSFELSDKTIFLSCVFSGDLIRPFVKNVSNKRPEKISFVCSKPIDDFLHAELLIENQKPQWYTLKACLYAALGEFKRNVNLIEIDKNGRNILDEVFQYVSNNYKEPISLEMVAISLGYEKHYLSRIINQSKSINFSRIVNWYRVDAATEILQATNLSMSEVATESGFQTIRNFNKIFYEYTGRKPLEVSKGISTRNRNVSDKKIS